MTRPARIALSIGCPSGIGPEVSVAAAAAERTSRVLLVGDEEAVLAAARGRRIDRRRIVRVAEPALAWGVARGRIALWQPTSDLAPGDRQAGSPTRASGAAQLAWIDRACDCVVHGEADALVTGPVSKEAIVQSRAPSSAKFLGHTEHLQRRLRAREVVMAFWSPSLVTSLATTHLPLAAVPRALTAPVVAKAAYWLAWLLSRTTKRSPRVVVAGLNPHAGEGGLLGREERSRIAPGIARARARLARSHIEATLEGPTPAESAFRLAVEGRWDGVVAMYHDQATIPMKLSGFGDAVNVSLGLPIVRTSVDHGTAYDRAGTWTADPRGMRAAISLAALLAASGWPPLRAVVQRVLEARVEVNGEVVGAIGRGLLAYVGFGRDDTAADRAWTIAKIVALRIFEGSDDGKMTSSVVEAGGALLLVSQFTLYGDVGRGKRPSFHGAMPPDEARVAYEAAVSDARATGLRVASGRFGADMKVHATIDGPVTLWIDSRSRTG